MSSWLQAVLDYASSPDGAYAFPRVIAYAMMCLFVGVMMFQAAVRRPRLLRLYDPELSSELDRPTFRAFWRRVVTGVLVILAVVTSASYFLRGAPSGRFFHLWDGFHTAVGAKYHDELGYFDLYDCSIAVDRQDKGYFKTVEEVRDLRTRKFVPVEEQVNYEACAIKFSPARLEEFRADLRHFGPKMSAHSWGRLFRDKGFNGTPFYTVLASSLVNSTDGSIEQLTYLALLDPLMMLLAFAAVGWAFGVRQAALFVLFFCTFFPNRFVHMGGSIVRFDYVAALIVGLCALKKDRWGLCGGLLAWAAMVRVFPAIFFVGLVIWMSIDALFARRIDPKHVRCVLAFSLTCVALTLVSLVGLDGPLDDYAAWVENMRVHTEKSAGFRVGFRHLFMIGDSVERVNYNKMQMNFQARQFGYYLCVSLLLVPLLLAVRRLDKVTFTALFGSIAFFLLAVSTRYYYAAFTLVFLVDRDVFKNRTLLSVAVVLFGASAFDFFYFSHNANDALMYNYILSAQLFAITLVLAAGLLFDPGLEDGAIPGS